MSTLTQFAPARPDHCPHKLPTSCRLTARPVCCACQDHRPHAATYRKYVDGVGFVMLGTRQDGYCWPCKEFWDIRTAVAGIFPLEARIPYVPDVTDFVNTWHDWHRGSRQIRNDDGTVQTQTLRGQSLNQVDIGQLPIPEDGGSPYHSRAVQTFARLEMPVSLLPREQGTIVIPEEDRLFDSEDEGEDSNSVQRQLETQPSHSHVRSLSEGNSNISSQTAHPDVQRPTENSNSVQSQSSEGQTDATAGSNSNIPSQAAHLSIQRMTGANHTIQSQASEAQRSTISAPSITAADARVIRGILSRTESLAASLQTTASRLDHIVSLNSSNDNTEVFQNLINNVSGIRDRASLLVENARLLSRDQYLLELTRQFSDPASTEPSQPLTVGPRVSAEASPQTQNNTGIRPQIETPAHLARQTARETRLAHLFGTREDVQQPDYQSPINLMFDRARAYGRRMMDQNQRANEERAQRELTEQRSARELVQALTGTATANAAAERSHGTSIAGQYPTSAVRSQIGFRPGVDHQMSIGIYSGGLSLGANRQIDHIFVNDRQHEDHEDHEAILMLIRQHLLRHLRRVVPRLQDRSQYEYECSVWRLISNFSTTAYLTMYGQTNESVNGSDPEQFYIILRWLEGRATRVPGTSLRSYLYRVCNQFEANDFEAPRYTEDFQPRTRDTPDNNTQTIEQNNIRGGAAPQRYSVQQAMETISTSIANPAPRPIVDSTRRRGVYLGPPTRHGARGSEDLASVLRPRSLTVAPVAPPLAPPVRPLETNEMQIKLSCTICQEQIADVALIPCGHLVMCRWCSERHAAIGDLDNEGRRIGTTCPLCRAKIKTRQRIWGLSGDPQALAPAVSEAVSEAVRSVDGGIEEGQSSQTQN